MPTRRNRVMRFLNTLRNKLTRRKKKLRRSRRRNKPRMSRLRSFLNRNRNRLRTRKNVAKGKNQQLKKKTDCKPKPGILRAPKPTVNPLLRRALQNPKQQKKKVTFSQQASNFKPPTTTKKKPTIDDIIEALRKSNISVKRSKSTDTNLSDLGKRRKSRKKNKRKY